VIPVIQMSGIGKTRLLHEISLDAQVKGALAVYAEAQPDAASFSLACAISLQLLAAQPELARRCAENDSGLLAALWVHAKDENASTFYRHFDFVETPSDPFHLFVLIKDLKRARHSS